MGKIDFTFPLPNNNLHKRYDAVFKALKKGLSVTIVGLPLSSRSAFFKFIIEKGSGYLKHFIDIDKFDFLNMGNQNLADGKLLRDLLLRISDKFDVLITENFDPLIMQLKIEKAILERRDNKKLVIFIPDFNQTLKGKPETIEFLVRLGEINKHNPNKPGVLFCFTASSGEFKTALINYPFKFGQIVSESFVKFDLLNKKELDYTRNRLEFFRSSKIEDFTHKLAVKLSAGHYILYKTLTGLEHNELEKVSKTFYHQLTADIILLIWNSTSTKDQQSLKKISPLFPPKIIRLEKFSGEILSLTAQESDVFEHLKQQLDKVTNRDEIGQVMWGKNWTEKYSDWAIDKLISKLKQKLIYSNYKILTVRGRGYKLINYAS